MNLTTTLIFAAWVIQPLIMIFRGKKTVPLIILRVIASLLMIYGAIGFFSHSLLTIERLDALLKTVEWPMGRVNNVLTTDEGYLIAPHTNSGRIQIYDSELNFIRGWTIDSRGGSFILKGPENDSFTIYTSRGSNIFTYDLEGNLLSSEKYSDYQADYMALRQDGIGMKFPTPFYLLTLAYPMLAWLFGIIGLGMHMVMVVLDKISKKREEEIYE